MLVDRYNRQITYLRVSVTDRCNYRCVYCMPAEGIAHQSRQEILTYEEIFEVVRAAVAAGIRKVRLTGGEPLVRRDIVSLVRQLADLPGLDDLSLTTNGLFLEMLARPLADAGLHRVNVSLDTTSPQLFSRMTRGGDVGSLWRGLAAAEAAGLRPIKLNVVVVRGVNSDEIGDLARLSLEHDWSVRFIELMPVGNLADWGDGFPPADQRYFSVQDMLQKLEPLKMEPLEPENGSGPARIFRIPGACGTVGMISPVGEHFCDRCNRLRLTADGNLRPCLLLDQEVPIREALRAGEPVLPYLQQAVDLKPEGHELAALVLPENRRMIDIGG